MKTIRSSLVFAVVALVHVVAVYLFAASLRLRQVTSSSVQSPTMLIFIPPKMQERTQAAKKLNTPASRRMPEIFPAVRDNAISSPSATTNWTNAAADTVSAVLARQRTDEAFRSLDSKPNVTDRPRVDSARPASATQRPGGAEIITWVDNTCYATNRSFDGPQLDENRLHIVCKDPFKGRTDLLDDLKPSYLRAPSTLKGEQPINGATAEAIAPDCTYSSVRCK